MAENRILLIEDDHAISDILAFNLKREGFAADCRYDGTSGLEAALAEEYDLILLDVMLPGLDGWEVLARLRESKWTPVVMLTAREEETDKVKGLELGADDYVTKPFSMKELMARVRANIRRGSLLREQAAPAVPAAEQPGIILDEQRQELCRGGKRVELTAREYKLMSLLLANPGRIFSREELLEQVWGYDGFLGDLRAVDVMVRRLRVKVEDDPSNPRFIQSKRNAGYFFEMPA